jgi:hypothetical protein
MFRGLSVGARDTRFIKISRAIFRHGTAACDDPDALRAVSAASRFNNAGR